METFYSLEELKGLGLAEFGENVKISRYAMIYQPHLLKVKSNVRIDDFCILSGNIILGNYIHISHFCGLYGGEVGIEMEDFSGLSSKVNIYAVSDDYSGESLTNPTVPLKYKPNVVSKKVVIKKHGILGTGSVVLPGVVVGEGASVGALSLCNRSLEPWSINVGSPAKKIRERSRKLLELEEELNKENLEKIHEI